MIEVVKTFQEFKDKIKVGDTVLLYEVNGARSWSVYDKVKKITEKGNVIFEKEGCFRRLTRHHSSWTWITITAIKR